MLCFETGESTRRETVRKSSVFLFFIAIAVMFSGCGRKSDNEVKALTEVVFHIDWIHGVDYIGYYIADEKGFYNDEGLKVTINTGNGAPQAAQLIGIGKIRVGTTTGDAIVLAQHQSVPVMAVAVIFPRNPVVLLSRADSPIRQLSELVGKRLGYHETSITYKQFLALAQRKGLNTNEVKLVEVGWGGAAELMQGTIDAVLAYTTDKPVELEARGERPHELRFDELGMEIIGQCIAVSKSTIEAKRKEDQKGEWETIQKFVRASIKGWEYARNNPDDAVGLFVRRFADQDEAKVRIGFQKTVELLPPSPSGYTADLQKLWEKTEENVRELEGLKPRQSPVELLFSPAN